MAKLLNLTRIYGNVFVDGNIVLNSNNSVSSAIINGGTNGSGNIGSSGAAFNIVFARSTSAQYADLAENYLSDEVYPAGTVVVFGGEKEITISKISHDSKVAGVISTNPAYLMNEPCPGLPVALQGRVPCRVKGPVDKGDMVVTSAVTGVAEKLDLSRYQIGCVIGKSLGTVEPDEIQLIEIVVGRD